MTTWPNSAHPVNMPVRFDRWNSLSDFDYRSSGIYDNGTAICFIINRKIEGYQLPTLIHQRVEMARDGRNPAVICRMPSGWAVLGDTQVTPGYAILLSDPVMPDLNALSLVDRVVYLRDMSIIGDALLEVTGAALINYEILGNTDRALHAHLVPRYADEPDEQRRKPIWFIDLAKAPKFDPERDRALMEKIAQAIQKRLTGNPKSQMMNFPVLPS
jgi:diadenosine tetraphosphate (Ap4A) HIT family hydrolase